MFDNTQYVRRTHIHVHVHLLVPHLEVEYDTPEQC